MPNLPRETAGILDNVRESGALADLIASNLASEQASVADKQKILSIFEPKVRVRAVLAIVNRQLELLRVKKEVSSMMADEGKAQREQILRQQMRSIKEELGEGGEEDEVDELRELLIDSWRMCVPKKVAAAYLESLLPRPAIRGWRRRRRLSVRVVLLVHTGLLAECLALVEDPQGLLEERRFVAVTGAEPDVALS